VNFQDLQEHEFLTECKQQQRVAGPSTFILFIFEFPVYFQKNAIFSKT